ncbi:MAG: YihY/virulence factor BrkB family protein [Candidatus Zixiibacteriota bacterium]|nr:MAG: YihY/virulence factor BrkB family protein [candidate division Zixibacteria bacterium]
MKLKTIWSIIETVVNEWSADKASTWAAALAYYTIFSLAPLLIIAIAVAGLFFGEEAASGEILHQMDQLIGPQGARAIQDLIQNARQPGAGIIAAVIGFAVLFWVASNLFSSMRTALNYIWEIAPRPGSGIWWFIRDRLISFGMVLSIGFVLMVSMLLSATIAAMGNYLGRLLNIPPAALTVINFVVSFLVVTLLVAMIFRYLPAARVRWSDLWLGAGLTAILFTIGKTLIGFYLGQSATASTYGAAGSLVVLLIWVYYSTQILFFGAEFTQVYAQRYGAGIPTTEGAVHIERGAEKHLGTGRKDEEKAGSEAERRPRVTEETEA